MRSLVSRWNWLKCTVRSSVAAYNPTGMLTSPNASAPLQITRAIPPPADAPPGVRDYFPVRTPLIIDSAWSLRGPDRSGGPAGSEPVGGQRARAVVADRQPL